MVAKTIAFGRATLSSLRARNFRLYFVGQLVSQTGGWIQALAQSWLVLHLTSSATALGIVSALQFAPTLLIGPYAGVLADRVPKRRLIVGTQVLAGLLALGLGIAVATDVVTVRMVYVTAGLLGIINAIDYPTRQSFLYELAGPRHLVSAVGLTSTGANLARVMGPALAGALIASTGLAACFIINAATYLVVIGSLLLMRRDEFHHTELVVEKRGVRKGLAYAARTPVVREALVMMAVIAILTYEFSVTLPAFVKLELGGGAAGLAYLMSAMGIGAALGGIITAGRRGDGLGTLSIAALGFGIVTALVGASPNLTVAAACMLFVGVFSAWFTALSNGILQMQCDQLMRNRVMALWSTAFLGSSLIGGPLMGWVAEVAGARWSLAAGLLGGLIAGAIGWAGVRRERATVRGCLPARDESDAAQPEAEEQAQERRRLAG